jgi:hypothetical protein
MIEMKNPKINIGTPKICAAKCLIKAFCSFIFFTIVDFLLKKNKINVIKYENPNLLLIYSNRNDKKIVTNPKHSR